MTEANHDSEAPEVGEYVQITYENDHGKESIKGRVTEVDTDPNNLNDLTFTVDEAQENSEIHYGEGVHEGEEYATVGRWNEFGGSYKLGDNAEWRVLR